jgi:hypothetical protein
MRNACYLRHYRRRNNRPWSAEISRLNVRLESDSEDRDKEIEANWRLSVDRCLGNWKAQWISTSEYSAQFLTWSDMIIRNWIRCPELQSEVWGGSVTSLNGSPLNRERYEQFGKITSSHWSPFLYSSVKPILAFAYSHCPGRSADSKRSPFWHVPVWFSEVSPLIDESRLNHSTELFMRKRGGG